ncbi:MAG TPA: TIGR00725 family protein [Firmicutes bacterium]|nr:TIGR00725 family protein [Bacillota bacterium]
MRIGVIGQAGIIPPEVERLAVAVGREIGRRGGILLSGGRDGVMLAASRGAREAGGITVGILPGNSTAAGNPYLDVPITTGLDFNYRSLVLVHSCDALIMIGGKGGTLLELTAAYKNGRPVVVLKGSGQWADRAEELLTDGCLDDRRCGEIRIATTPEEAVALAFSLAQEACRQEAPFCKGG